jgi:hypothetical protein
MLALEGICLQLYCISFAINVSLNISCIIKVMFSETVAQDLCFNSRMFSGYGLLGCDIVQTCWWVPTFRRNMLPHL